MPKIRNKNSGNINKSGYLNQTYKSYIKDKQNKISFFKKEKIHNIFKSLNSNINFFDDSRTFVFEEKNVNPTVFIENKYIPNNKVLHTPNTFPDKDDVNFKRSVTVSRENFDKVVDYNYLDSENVFFDESSLDKENIIDRKDNIKIKFKRSSSNPIELAYNFSGATQNNITNNNFGITFPSINYGSLFFKMPICGNTVYLDANEDKYVDYLTDVKYNKFNSLSDFLTSPIIFSGLTYSSDQTPKTLSNYNIPVSDFGFPYDAKFRPKDNHMISMKDYIKKPFFLEKVILNTSISNWSVSDTSNITEPCLNFINFFIINQRGSLSSNSLKQQRDIEYVNSSSLSSLSLDNNYDDNQKNTRKFTRLKTTFDESRSKYSKEDDGIFEDTNTDLSSLGHRELVTNISIVNYSRKTSTFPYFSSESFLSSNCDIIYNNTANSLLDSNNNSECIYENKKVAITSNVKSFKKQKILPRFTHFNIYPKKENATRSNTSRRSERSSILEENTLENLENLYTDTYGKSIEIFNTTNNIKNTKDNGYIIYPEDLLTFGISLTTNFSPKIASSSSDYDERSGRDIVHINDDIDFTLVGYYLENEKEKTIYQKKIHESKNVKVVGQQNSEVVDKLGNNLSYLCKGSYFDHISSGIAGKNYTDKNSTENVNFYSKNINNTFSNFLILLDENLSYKEKTNSSSKKIKHLYNLRHYGFYADRLNSNYYPAYTNTEFPNREFFRIKKLFKKGHFIEKNTANGDTINSYNKDKNCKLENSEIAFVDPSISIESTHN